MDESEEWVGKVSFVHRWLCMYMSIELRLAMKGLQRT